MSWLGNISQHRIQAKAHRPAVQDGADAPKVNPAKFADTLISEGVLKRFGQNLAPAVGDMQAIAQAGHSLKTHRASQFNNAVDQFYSALGRSTDNLDPDLREAVVKASMGAMRALTETLHAHPALMPAMAALSSLLEPRGKFAVVSPEQHADAAKTMVVDLTSRFEARVGTTSMLFGFRNLVEAFESNSENLTAQQRPEIWAAISNYLDDVVPRPGCDQGQLGTMTGLVLRALRDPKNTPAQALSKAKGQILDPLKPGIKATLQQLKVVPEGVKRGSLGKTAFNAMSQALAGIIKDNPAGPDSLIQAVEQVQGKLSHTAEVDTDRTAQAYKHLAMLLSTCGKTSAVVTVLEHVAGALPEIVTDERSQKVISRAGRITKPESLAPVLVQAHVARSGEDPKQDALCAALAQYKRLPPGPSLRAAVAILPRVTDNHAGPLAEALFVECRTAESQEEIEQFVHMFADAYPQLHQLGDDAGLVTTAFAKEALKADDDYVLRKLAGLVTSTKAALPKTPVSKLLNKGKNGEAGLIALAHHEDFIHAPSDMAVQLLKLVGEHRPKTEATTECRVAMQIAGELGRFDRDPNRTDFPKVSKDFEQALEHPETLVSAEGAIPAGQAPSLRGYLEGHPELPPEIAFTAAQLFDQPRLSWVRDEMGSTRSNDFKRVIRDATYAAASGQHAYFFSVLKDTNSDRKAQAAALNMIAMGHRQGNEIPWDQLIDGLIAGGDPATQIEKANADAAMKSMGLDKAGALDPEGMALLRSAQPQLEALLDFLSKPQYGAPKEYFIEPLKVAVKAQADGSWPAPKYESPSAKEHLAPLKPKQLEAWKQNMVTGTGAVVPVDDSETTDALHLLRGVAQTMTDHVQIGGAGFEAVKWNAPSLKRLRDQQTELLTKLHKAKKGSPTHRSLCKTIGPVRHQVALLDLQQGLHKHFGPRAKAIKDPQATLAAIKPLALAAFGALRAQGANGFIEALDTAAYAVHAKAGGNPRSGSYACDDDTLDAYLTAFGGGCIHPVNGFNRGSLVELIGGSQYKMIRAMDGDKPIGRSFLRLIRVEMENGYKGMALRIDPPQASSAGAPSAKDKALMYKHALGKAVAMDVPLLVSDDVVMPEVEARGLKMAELTSKVFVHKGITGMHHTQGFSNRDYFIAWPEVNVAHGGAEQKDAQEAQREYQLKTVMPPSWKAKAK